MIKPIIRLVTCGSVDDGKSTLIGGIEKKGWFSTLVEDDELFALEAAKKHCPVNIIRYEELK